MPPAERGKEASQWLAIASKDLNAARLLLTHEPSAALFHCQQAVEKSLKAFLTFHEVSFRRTHDLNELGMQCVNLKASLAPLLEEASALTDFAVLFRYTDAPGEPDESEAVSGLATASLVYEAIVALVTEPIGKPRATSKGAPDSPGANARSEPNEVTADAELSPGPETKSNQ